MKKGLTLIELVVVLVVIAIIASLAIPSFKGIIRNTYISEVYGMASLIISGARYYDFKYDFDNFDATDPSQYWGALNVNIPNNAKCRYEITGGAHATKLLTIYSTPPGTA